MDFQTIFDVTKLDDIELGHLEFIVNSPSYLAVFEPYLRRTRDSLNTLLIRPDYQRKAEYPDDFLRGDIVVVDGLLKFCKQLVEETQIERIRRSQEVPEEDLYLKLSEEGVIKPRTGIDPNYIPPEEDF